VEYSTPKSLSNDIPTCSASEQKATTGVENINQGHDRWRDIVPDAKYSPSRLSAKTMAWLQNFSVPNLGNYI
jgi:hypothetical protein